MDRRLAGIGFSVLLLLSGWAGCDRSIPFGFKNVDYEGAKEMLDSDSPPAVIDVRTPEEFVGELGHIPGARLVPLQGLQDSLEALSNLRDRDILVVCRTGHRSTLASHRLTEAGFTRVYNLAGGMKSWNENGGRIEKSAM